MSNDRKKQVLKAIVQHFIATAEPVGSQTIIVSYKFDVSPATIRNEMASLEEEGFIYQPHTSSGRVPTQLGYREFVNELVDFEAARLQAHAILEKITHDYQREKVRARIYDAVQLLARASNSVSFATVPDNHRTFFLGISNVLKQPEFAHNQIQASQVMEVLENDDRFVRTLRTLDVTHEARVFIGTENILEQIQSCSIIVTRYKLADFEGFFGVLGPTRMDYALNITLIEEIKKMLNQ